MNVPKYLYDEFPDKTELFDIIKISLSVLADEKKQELVPKINNNVVLTKLVFRFLVYIQIALYRICDISKSILKSWEDKNISSAFILLRALYENISVIYETNLRLEKLIKKGDFILIHKLIYNLIYCSRNEKTIVDAVQIELERIKKGIGAFENEEEIRKVYTARQILDVMDAISKIEPEHKADYDRLCEYTHPNYDGMLGLYGMWKDEFTLKISNENGVSEINVNNFFTRFNSSILMFIKAYDEILKKFNDITEIVNQKLKKDGRESEIYGPPL